MVSRPGSKYVPKNKTLFPYKIFIITPKIPQRLDAKPQSFQILCGIKPINPAGGISFYHVCVIMEEHGYGI